MSLIDHKSWLDPVLPADLPDSILKVADDLPFKAGYLAGHFAPETGAQIAKLLRITNTYYSNLIEGQYSEPAEIQQAQAAPRKDRKRLKNLAVQQLGVQELFERLISKTQRPWPEMFSIELIAAVHKRLFEGAQPEELLLGDGTMMVPGELRSASGREVVVGQHFAPTASAVEPMLKHLQAGFGKPVRLGLQIVSALANHHRLAWVHPFIDGNGRVVRLMTHLQLTRLGLSSGLWSLSRGLARRQDEYYRRLSMADRSRQGDFDGRGQMSRKYYFEFIEFMLDVCDDQIQYMTAALKRDTLAVRIERTFRTNERLLSAGIKPGSAKAINALIAQGTLPRNDVKIFTGLTPRPSIDELGRLIEIGLIKSETPKSRKVTPGFPVWFAQEIFPDLHRRFN